jgi:UDP-glucose 4-epimerase
MTKKLFIVGGRSNLSGQLSRTFEGAELISGDEMKLLPNLLLQAGRSNLIYNLYFKSAWLGRRDVPEEYSKYAFQRLSEFTAICRDFRQYIDKVIFTSSSAVYGCNTLAVESDRCDITNMYASIKLSSELFLGEHLADTGISLVIARVFNMYGGVDEFSVVSRIVKAISCGVEFPVSNHGQSVRDFIHIQDVVEIYRRLLTSSFSGVINIGTGTGISLNELIKKAEIAFECKLRITYIERNEINHSVANINKLLAAVGVMNFSPIQLYFQEQSIVNISKGRIN